MPIWLICVSDVFSMKVLMKFELHKQLTRMKKSEEKQAKLAPNTVCVGLSDYFMRGVSGAF